MSRSPTMRSSGQRGTSFGPRPLNAALGVMVWLAVRHTIVIPSATMKVAISLPDPVFTAAEQLAKELQVPRSQLYAEAIAQYLERRGGSAVTAKLNSVYSEQESNIPAEFASAQSSILSNEAW